MAEATLKLGLDLSEVNAALNSVEDRLRRAAASASNAGRGSGGGTSAVQRAEQEALRLAQAQARLQTATGNLAQAQQTLLTAMHGVSAESLATIRAQTQLAQVQNRLENQTRQNVAGYNEFSGTLRNLISIYAAFNFAQRAVNEAVNLDSAKRALIAVTGSAQAAEEQLKRLREIAKLPGIDFEGAVRGATRLQAVGFSAKESERALKAFANAVALTGGGADQLREITVQLAQLSSKGKVLAQDLRPIIEAAPAVGQALQKIFGTVDAKTIADNLKKAGIDTKQFINQILIPSLEQLPRVNAGAKESFENLKQAANLALARIGEAILRDVLPTIERLIPVIESLTESWTKLSPTTQDAVLAATAFAFVAKPLFSLIGGGVSIVSSLANAYRGLAGSIVAANTAAGGAAAGGGLLAALGTKLGLGVIGTALLQQGDVGQKARAARDAGDERVRQLQRQAGLLNEFGPSAQESTAAAAAALARDRQRIQSEKELQVIIDRVRGAKGGLSDSDAKAAAAAAKQVREARLSEVRAGLQDELKLYLDFAKDQKATNEASYKEDLISTRDYLENRRLLTEAEIEKVIGIRDRETASIQHALEMVKTGTPEAIRLQKELGEVNAKSALQVADLTAELQKKINADQIALVLDEKRLQKARENFALIENLKAAGEKFLSGQEQVIDPRTFAADRAAGTFDVRNLELRKQELEIQNQVSAGLLNEAEARQQLLATQRAYRDELIQLLDVQKQNPALDARAIEEINVQIEQLRTLGNELTPAQAFFAGLRDESRTLADSLRDAGRTLKSDFIDLFDQGISKLTNRFGVFGNTIRRVLNDLVGFAFNDLIRAIFGLPGSNGANGSAGSGGGGGIRGIIQQTLGGVFNRNGIGPGGTAVFNPNAAGGGSNFISQLAGLNFGITAPPSIGNGLPNVEIGSSGGATGGLGRILSGLGLGNLGSLFKGIGFGKTAGSGGALASALPLLGLTLGAGVGGSSILGQILGGAGGLALGVGLTAAPAALAGSSLGFLAPLFSNPFTAIAGVAALAGALLLGRAAARKKDEATSGDSLQRAIDQIKDLKRQADSGQLTSIAEAESSFTAIHRQFINETLQLKTKSVRESRLNNQGDITPPLHPDSLRLLFEREALPAIIAANTRRGVFDKLIPEFATGGVMGRTGLALLHDGEVIMNAVQQRRLTSLAGADVFARVGVPNAVRTVGTGTPSFASGGVFTANGNSNNNSSPVVISELTVEFNVGPDLATEIVKVGGSTVDGRKVTVQNVRTALRNGEI